MVARCKPPARMLRVTFHRDGETPLMIEADDGDKALWRTIRLLMAHRELMPGDRLTVELAD